MLNHSILILKNNKMERGKKEMQTFINKGSNFRIGTRIIKRNQRFTAHAYQIPKAFSDVIIPLDAVGIEEAQQVDAVPVTYVKKERENAKGYWDVFSTEDPETPVNDKALREKEADTLISVLGEEEPKMEEE